MVWQYLITIGTYNDRGHKITTILLHTVISDCEEKVKGSAAATTTTTTAAKMSHVRPPIFIARAGGEAITASDRKEWRESNSRGWGGGWGEKSQLADDTETDIDVTVDSRGQKR